MGKNGKRGGSLDESETRFDGGGALPDMVFDTIIDAIAPLFTNPEYAGMFKIVTGDQAIYTQTADLTYSSLDTLLESRPTVRSPGQSPQQAQSPQQMIMLPMRRKASP
jgi:hypothetical protein